MKTKFLLIVITCWTYFVTAQTPSKITTELGKLTAEEIQTFTKIGTNDFGKLLISNDVLRYYKNVQGQKVNFFNEMIFKEVDGLINGEYVYYTLAYEWYDKDHFKIIYSFSLGGALSGEGSVIKIGNKIIQTEIDCGTGGCSIIVLQNNKIVYEKD